MNSDWKILFVRKYYSQAFYFSLAFIFQVFDKQDVIIALLYLQYVIMHTSYLLTLTFFWSEWEQ